MSKQITKEIGGHTFYIDRIPPFDALEIAGELQRVFAPSLAALAAMRTEDNSKLDAVTLSSLLMDSAEALGRNLDGKMLRYLAELMLREDSVSIKPKDSDKTQRLSRAVLQTHVDDVSVIFELLVEVIRHNFSELFNKAATLIGNDRFKSSKVAAKTETEATNDPLDN